MRLLCWVIPFIFQNSEIRFLTPGTCTVNVDETASTVPAETPRWNSLALNVPLNGKENEDRKFNASWVNYSISREATWIKKFASQTHSGGGEPKHCCLRRPEWWERTKENDVSEAEKIFSTLPREHHGARLYLSFICPGYGICQLSLAHFVPRMPRGFII